MVDNILEIRHLTKTFSTGFFKKKLIRAVDNVSFEIQKEPSSITTLVGESGSGKSTIARMLLLLINPTSGEIIFNGKKIEKLKGKALMEYRKDIQAIFQDPYQTFNPFYKVDYVLSTPIKNFNIASSKSEEKELISNALEQIGLIPEEILGKYPHQLSGGERQRIMVARAFILKPKMVIADEPISMVDASLRASILEDMFRLKEDLNVSFLYITHDLSTAYNISDNIIILYKGSIVEMGNIDKVIKNPLHPYLQLLISSIPIPDPEKRWSEKIGTRTEEITYTIEKKGCKFYNRCPQKMEKCKDETPELVAVEEEHLLACHLFDSS